jgi:hypothetical protein
MYSDEAPRPSFGARLGVTLDRAESVYLRVLRAVVLVIATLLIVYAAGLAVVSLYKVAQSPDSVQERPAQVAANELTSAEMPSVKSVQAADSGVNPEQREWYDQFVAQYYRFYRSKFEPFRQSEDKQLSRSEFDGAFLGTTNRLERVKAGDLSFAEDQADLNYLFRTMSEAAELPATKQRLNKYKSAKKVRTATKVERTRTVSERGWNSYSTSCRLWYEDPIGCPETRTRQVPYIQTVYSMRLPEGTQSHSQIFRAFQDQFFQLLEERRQRNRSEAQTQRDQILLGIEEGKLSLSTALMVVGGFVVLMFFFLLIAVERHQRRLARTEVTSPLTEALARAE